MKHNNKKIIILFVFVISLFSFATLLTISRYNNKQNLSGHINTKIIRISFTPNGDDEYKTSQSSIVEVTHKTNANFTSIKYEFLNTQVDASAGTSFSSGDEITKTNVEGIYYICVYAEDENGLYNNVCSDEFYIDDLAPRMNITSEGNIIIVEVEENGSGIKSVTSDEGLTLDHVDDNKYYFVAIDALSYNFTATDNLDNTRTENFVLCSRLIGTITNFDYTGNVQEFIASCPGKYKAEAWGAQGGGNNENISGGKGGYTAGILTLEQPRSLYVYVGGAGNQNEVNVASESLGGYNGGGNSLSDTNLYRIYGSGGGATDIRLTDGDSNDFDSLKTRIMVAAGGGGAYSQENNEWYSNGGYAGGLVGSNGNQVPHWDQTYCYGQGGIQNGGVSSTSNCTTTYSTEPISSGFGYGGSYRSGLPATGGGAGYYGGSRSGHVASAGGGSSFISGYNGCDAITEDSTENNITHTGQPNHYSGYIFTNPVMIDGAGCNWQTGVAASCFVQPQPNGGRSVGHSGDGYARFTYLGDNFDHIITLNSDDFTYHGTTTVIGKYYNDLPSIASPTSDAYIFKGYYDNQEAFDLTYSLPTSTSTNYRINLVDAANNWSMTNADAGTHISAKITLNTLEVPQVEFNDRVIIPYKTEIMSDKIILYLDFDITLDMVTNTTYPYETTYRFIDLFFTNNIVPSSIVVDHVTKGGTKYYNDAGQSVFPYNKDVRTLYAHKMISNYNITYDLAGGTVSIANPISYSSSGETFTLNNPTKNGYTFTGWTGSNGTTPQITVTIEHGSMGNRTYTANWTPTNYTISYTLNGGSVSGNPSSYNIETNSFTLANPTKSGFTFTGWTGTDLSSASTSVTIAKGSTGDRSYTANFTDSSAPQCTLTVTTSGVSFNTKTDNVAVTSYGMNKTGTADYNSTTSLTLGTGTFYGYVKDAAGNKGSCSATLSSTTTEYTKTSKTCYAGTQYYGFGSNSTTVVFDDSTCGSSSAVTTCNASNNNKVKIISCTERGKQMRKGSAESGSYIVIGTTNITSSCTGTTDHYIYSGCTKSSTQSNGYTCTTRYKCHYATVYTKTYQQCKLITPYNWGTTTTATVNDCTDNNISCNSTNVNKTYVACSAPTYKCGTGLTKLNDSYCYKIN